MFKRTKLSIISSICYAIFLFGGIGSAAYMYFTIQESNASGGAGLEAIAFALIMIIGLIYAAAALLPFIFALCDKKANKKVFAALCIPFDIAFNVAGAAFILDALNDIQNGYSALILPAILMLIALVALICNISSLKCSRYE